jgi:hypothetical protein
LPLPYPVLHCKNKNLQSFQTISPILDKNLLVGQSVIDYLTSLINSPLQVKLRAKGDER